MLTTHHPDAVEVTLLPSTEQLERITATIKATAEQINRSLAPALRSMARAVDRAIGQPQRTKVAGLEGRYYVRAAMDPAYATEDGLAQLVASILDPRTRLDDHAPLSMAALLFGGVSPAQRAGIAAEAIRGWVTHRDPDTRPDSLCWHRLLGSTSLVVTRG